MSSFSVHIRERQEPSEDYKRPELREFFYEHDCIVFLLILLQFFVL
jgi:hypothetical protein